MPEVTKNMLASVLAPYIEAHIAEKQIMGCRFTSQIQLLRRFDYHLAVHHVAGPNLERSVVEEWLKRSPNESASTQSGRVACVRQFCIFLKHQGFAPFIPGKYPGNRQQFVPYIFTREEIHSLLTFVDNLREDVRYPHRRMVFGLVFRLLYGCGLRISEVLHLTVDNVDLDAGVLRIVDTKFRKDRLIPIAQSLTERLQAYIKACPPRNGRDYLFRTSHGGQWIHRCIYDTFRQALWECRISHHGRGKGPRIHDIRHTFACHCLSKWIHEERDLDVMLPVLSAYMGHQSPYHTQRYLHFVADMYPDIVQKLDAQFGHIISRKEYMG